MTMRSGWAVAAVPLNFGETFEPVAGWRYGALFLDFRPLREVPRDNAAPFCWMVCHALTGLAIVGLRTDLPTAQGLAEQLHQCFPWESIAAVEDQTVPGEVQFWVDSLPCCWCMAIDTIAPNVEVLHRHRPESVQ